MGLAMVPYVGGVKINEGGRKRARKEYKQKDHNKKKGKGKMEESPRQREAIELKEPIKILKKIKKGSNSKIHKRPRVGTRIRLDRVIASGFTHNYCETKRRKP